MIGIYSHTQNIELIELNETEAILCTNAHVQMAFGDRIIDASEEQTKK